MRCTEAHDVTHPQLFLLLSLVVDSSDFDAVEVEAQSPRQHRQVAAHAASLACCVPATYRLMCSQCRTMCHLVPNWHTPKTHGRRCLCSYCLQTSLQRFKAKKHGRSHVKAEEVRTLNMSSLL